VLLDALSLHSGGARTFLRGLLGRPGAAAIQLLITPSRWEELELSPDDLALHFAPETTRHPIRRQLWRQVHLGALSRRAQSDVYCDPAGGAPRLPIPRVVMVTNMLPFDRRFPRWYRGNPRQLLRLWLLRARTLAAVRAAEGVIFLSEWSRSVVLRHLAAAPRRQRVIPHGVELPLEAPRLPEEHPSILYVSDIEPYKRQVELVQAYGACFAEGLRPGRLVLAGAPLDRSSDLRVRRLAASLPSGASVVLAGWLRAPELEDAYRRADILAAVSSVECCPNTLLEALARGKPVLCSREPPMPEFAGDAVVSADPADPASLTAGLRHILSLGAAERVALGERARGRAAGYSWERSAAQIWDFLEEVRASSAPADENLRCRDAEALSGPCAE
jgi:glycosyltransferase involved in cell wall biosynthesis